MDAFAPMAGLPLLWLAVAGLSAALAGFVFAWAVFPVCADSLLVRAAARSSGCACRSDTIGALKRVYRSNPLAILQAVLAPNTASSSETPCSPETSFDTAESFAPKVPGCASRSVCAVCAAAFGAACAWALWHMMVGVCTAAGICAVSGEGALGAAALAAARYPAWLGMWAALLIAVICDMAARVIPKEACGCAGAAGVLLQLASGGVFLLACGAAFGALVVGLCLAVNRIGRTRGRGEMVGGGDIRCIAALSLACGAQAPVGFAACFSAAAICGAIGLSFGKMRRSSAMPLAPFFCLWALAGTAAAIT